VNDKVPNGYQLITIYVDPMNIFVGSCGEIGLNTTFVLFIALSWRLTGLLNDSLIAQ
jgi:hypothetical protein